MCDEGSGGSLEECYDRALAVVLQRRLASQYCIFMAISLDNRKYVSGFLFGNPVTRDLHV